MGSINRRTEVQAALGIKGDLISTKKGVGM
jgi:hypothetical protein